jgi:hypothetical protein
VFEVSVHEQEGETVADREFWLAHPEIGAETRARIERLRPPRPFWVAHLNPEAMARWAASWRLAAAYALAIDAHESEHDLGVSIWTTSRELYQSDLAAI